MQTLENLNNLDNQKRKHIIVVLVAALVVVFFILLVLSLNFSIVQGLITGWIFTTLYSIFAFLFIWEKAEDHNKVFEKPVYIEKPVIREVPVQVPIQIPIENKTIEIIDNPTIEIREVPIIKEKIITKKTKVKKPRKTKKLNIPKYKFVGSKQTKRFHKKSCRLGKLIKNKYKINSNSESYFIKRKFKKCKVCLKTSRKNKQTNKK